MAKVYYARVSTEEQNIDRQTAQAKELNCDEVFVDKLSGKDTKRPQLNKMMDYLRKGDTVIVSDISRLARSTRDLLNIIDQLNNKGVAFVSVKESIDTSTPQGKFMLTVFGAMAELERENILQRQREGIEIAKQKGIYKGRKPIQLDDSFVNACKEWRKGNRTATSVFTEYHMTATTFYRKVKQMGL